MVDKQIRPQVMIENIKKFYWKIGILVVLYV